VDFSESEEVAIICSTPWRRTLALAITSIMGNPRGGAAPPAAAVMAMVVVVVRASPLLLLLLLRESIERA
jgi:hypothetical protein